MRHQRYVMLSFVVAAILVGVTAQSATSSFVVATHIGDGRWLGVFNTTTAVSIGLAAATFGGLIRNRKAVSFTDEVVDELAKVTWPTKDETVKASTTVVFTALFTAALLAGYDLIWKNVADYFLFNQG